MLGALFALLSAASFGFNNASARRGMISTTVLQGIAITLPIGVPLFFMAALIGGEIGAIFSFGLWPTVALATAGIIHFYWARTCTYRAVKAIGSNLAGPVQQLTVLIALGTAMIFLGETLTPLKIIGIILVFLGPAIMISGRGKKSGNKGGKNENTGKDDSGEEKPAEALAAQDQSTTDGKGETPSTTAKAPPFEPRYLEGYTYAALSAIGTGLSPVLVRYALEENGASLAGGFIGYFAATVVFAIMLIPGGRFAHVLLVDRRAVPWFLNSGFFAFLAQVFRYMALAIAPVNVVTPIQRLSLVFRFLFSMLLNRSHEVFDWKVVVGIVLSLFGAILLAISVELVADIVPLPALFLDWTWP